MKHLGRASDRPDGKPTQAALASFGPLIGVVMEPAPVVAKSLREQGNEVPFLGTKLLIDTGAERTCVLDDLLQELPIAPHKTVNLVGVSGKPEPCPSYLVQIRIGMGNARRLQGWGVFVTSVIGVPPQEGEHPDCGGLLGRDFLRHVTFTYRGLDGTFEIEDHAKPPGAVEAQPAPVNGRQARKAKRRAERQARRKSRGR